MPFANLRLIRFHSGTFRLILNDDRWIQFLLTLRHVALTAFRHGLINKKSSLEALTSKTGEILLHICL